MRIVQLTSDDIVNNWQAIKFSACAVNVLSSAQWTARYCRGLLIGLLCAKTQCFFCIDEDTRELKVVIITRIQKDAGDVGHLLLDVVYGFVPTTDEEKQQVYRHMMKFAENLGLASVTAYTGNAMAGNAAKNMGLRETHRVYSAMVGG